MLEGKKVSDRSKVYFIHGFVICINTLPCTQKQMGFTVTKMDLLRLTRIAHYCFGLSSSAIHGKAGEKPWSRGTLSVCHWCYFLVSCPSCSEMMEGWQSFAFSWTETKQHQDIRCCIWNAFENKVDEEAMTIFFFNGTVKNMFFCVKRGSCLTTSGM